MVKGRINELIQQVCEVRKHISGMSYPVRSSDPEGVKALSLLRKLGEELQAALVTNEKGVAFRISKGQSNLPTVLWVAFLPVGRKAYDSYSVGVCFDTRGKGVIVGLMDPAGFPQKKLPTINRTNDKLCQLNVNGPKRNTHFNDRFVNPREFLQKKIDEKNFLNHLDESLSLLIEVHSNRFR